MNRFKEIEKVFNNLNDLPIYIVGHITPDQDSIGSSIALMEYLTHKGKTVYTLIRNHDEKEIAYQNNYTGLVNDITDKEYNLILLDVNEVKRIGKDYYDYFKNATYTINIDHHQDNTYECNYTLSIPNCSSTCEIIFKIINANEKYFNQRIIDNLYTGMLNDTNGFSRRITDSTMLIAQKLINLGANYSLIQKETQNKRTLVQMKALAKLVNEIKYDDFHYVILNKSDPIFSSLTHNEIVKQIAEDLRKINDIDTFILLIKDGSILKAKVMTKTRDDANKIAELFGGGGHKKEAGFTISDINENDVIKETKKYLKKNNQR